MKFLFIFSIFLAFSIGIYSFSTVYAEQSAALTSSIAYFPPPLKQIRDGQNPANVTCTEGLEIILKQSNGLPACIKPSSVAKLIQRGWAIHILPDYTSNNNNSEIFQIGTFETTSGSVNYFESSNGYLVRPTAAGNFPAIIMIHEWWGLNDNCKRNGR